MPNVLPGQITLPTRDELISRWKQDYLNRVPDSDPDDPQLEVDAAVNADSQLPLYANQRVIGSNAVLEDATGDALTQWGIREGVGLKLQAQGASGFVTISASLGGTTITDGDIAVNNDTSLKYQAVITDGTELFNDGDQCPVVAVDVGPRTNAAGGTALTWSSPPSGCGPTAIVFENTDGTGLTGGRDTETDSEYSERIRSEKADRSKSGNDADYRRTVKEVVGIRVQEAFTWPGINGTGTTAACALMAPTQSGGARAPNEAQRALIEAYVVGQMPADDASFFPVITEQPVDITYRVRWSREAAGWADVNPWPLFYPVAGTPGPVVVASAADATHFVLSATSYTGSRSPAAGNTIAFYNQAAGAFARKRILTSSGSGPWTIVVDTTNNSSDTTYVPVAGQRAMPYSKSMTAMLPGILTYFDSLGPGEMVASFYDEGRRQRRQPEAPGAWPNVLTTKGLENAIDIPEIIDRSVVEGSGITTTVGTAGVLAHVMRLRGVSVFAL